MDNHRWWGYSKLTKNKIELDALSDSGDAKTLRVSLAPPQALAPHTSHLVKLSLPNIVLVRRHSPAIIGVFDHSTERPVAITLAVLF